MSRKAEQRLWDTMLRQKNNRYKSSELMHQRIENRVGAGVPDTFWKPVCFYDCWIELKAPITPARPGTRLFRDHAALDIEQRNWALDYDRVGGRWFLVARDSEMELYMFGRDSIMTINELSVEQARASRIADNWDSIFGYIVGDS